MASATPLGGGCMPTVVMDVGRSNTRAGFAGDDTPRLINSSLAVQVDDNPHGTNKTYIDICKLTPSQKILKFLYAPNNPEDRKFLWKTIVQHSYQHLSAKPNEYALLFVEPMACTATMREEMAQHFFETLGVPALCMPRPAELAALSVGRVTAAVLDLGGSANVACAVVDGMMLPRSVQQSRVTSATVAKLFAKFLSDRKSISFDIESNGESTAEQDLRRYLQRGHMMAAYEALCRVGEHGAGALPIGVPPETEYELPDGRVITVGGTEGTPNERDERYVHGECFFNESTHPGMQPLPALVLNAVNVADSDAHRELLRNVVLTGGGSCLPGLVERLEVELRTLALRCQGVPSILQYAGRVAVNAPPPAERRYGAWLGGSILASMSGNHALWMSKAEYDEFGASLLARKGFAAFA